MLKDILSISGQSGLFKLVVRSTKSIIVESLETKQRIPVYFTSKVSSLEDIAIYTDSEELPLAQVFEKIYKMENKGETSVSTKSSSDDIKEYFEDLLPDYDKERVYVSDMKKVIQWYNILLKNGYLKFEEEKPAKEKVEKKAAEKKAVEKKADEEPAKPKKTKATKTTKKKDE